MKKLGLLLVLMVVFATLVIASFAEQKVELANPTPTPELDVDGMYFPYFGQITCDKNINIKLTIGSNNASVNGKQVLLDAPPYIAPKTGRTLVPIRFIGEALGIKFTWDAENQNVILKYFVSSKDSVFQPTNAEVYPRSLSMRVGYPNINCGFEGVCIEQAPEISNDRVMLPLRDITKTLGLKSEWNSEEKSITITKIDFSQLK